MKKSILWISLFLTLNMLNIMFNPMSVKANPSTIIVPDDFSTIQEAINAANSGDTIYVKAGTYNESVEVNKAVSLIGENKTTTIIEGDWAVQVLRDNVAVCNFTIRGGTFGIFVYGCLNTTISNNRVTNTGAWWDNTGIYLLSARHAVLRNNAMYNNTYNFWIWGTGLPTWIHDIDTTNTVDGKVFHYLINEKKITIDYNSFPNIGYLAVVNSTDITVRNLNMSKNGQGIVFAYTNNSIITNATVSDNVQGIELEGTSNITIRGNVITHNRNGIRLESVMGGGIIVGNIIEDTWLDTGLYLDEVSAFDIYHNNLVNNQLHAFCSYPQSHSNTWDNGYPSGGNYWSNFTVCDDYSGPYQNETGSDGIGDAPYMVEQINNQDNYPLMNKIVRDIAIINITVSSSEVQAGEDVNITVLVENQGALTNRFNETFDVSSYYDNVPIETKTVTDLAPGKNVTLNFTWDTKYVADGNFTIKAKADVVVTENETTDNTYVDGTVRVHQSTRYMQNAKWDSTYWKLLWNNTLTYTSQARTMPGLIPRGYLGFKIYKGTTCISGTSVITVGSWTIYSGGMRSTTWNCNRQNVTGTYIKMEIWYKFQGYSWTSMNVAFKTETFTENTTLNATTWTIYLFGSFSQWSPRRAPSSRSAITFFWGSSSKESRINEMIFFSYG